ncbi:NAC domain-containing protein [Sporodiniella umbellata]|nr:NAC domain-containing protein [Sporodiniella umbellata]
MSTENAQATTQSRAEQKARKSLLALGLKPVNGINRVTFTRGRGMVFTINNPEVFKSNNSDTHIVFGEMAVEDMAARAQQAAMEQQLAADAEASEEKPAEAEAVEAEEDEEEVDAEGVEEKDIELVVTQAKVSRAKAINALKKNNNDVVNSIMELTM